MRVFRLATSALAAIGIAALLAGCTETTYTAFEGNYNPYLRQKVFERHMWGTDADKRRAMRFALTDLQAETGQPYSAAFFRDLGFTCDGGNVCTLRVQRYIYRTKKSNLGFGNQYVQAPGDFGDVATVIYDTYTVSYTPSSINVEVATQSNDYMAP
jgi:hypothetical protein